MRHRLRRLSMAAVVLLAASLIAACGDTSATAPPATGMSQVPTTPAETAQPPTATAEVLPAATEVAAGTDSGVAVSIPVHPPQVPRVTPEELKAALDAGEALVVIDTRSAGLYASKHIPDSISIPLAEIEARSGELDPAARLVLYCT
jgi:hypothetical protein